MSDFIIKIAIADDVFGWVTVTPELPDEPYDVFIQEPLPRSLIAENATDRAYLSHSSADWSVVAHEIVGEWDEYTGAPAQLPTADYTAWIRPLGNKSGVATGFLDSPRWQGHSEPKFFEYDDADPEDVQTERYPAYSRPFTLIIERTLITDDGWPHIPHGWKVTMISEDPLRDITARAIGIYSDPKCTAYLYTTGAFIKGGLGTFFTECPIGQRTADEVPINFALLRGSAQEGIWNMEIGNAEDARQFWSKDQ